MPPVTPTMRTAIPIAVSMYFKERKYPGQPHGAGGREDGNDQRLRWDRGKRGSKGEPEGQGRQGFHLGGKQQVKDSRGLVLP